MNRIGRMLLIGTAVVALSACQKKVKESDLPPPPASTGETIDQAGPVKGSQEDFLASVMSDKIYFDTDEYNIDSQDQAILQSQAQWLNANPTKRVTIEGHADERGTRDYNLALGERRANAAKNYLASIGIDPSRITTVSYGKERPTALGSDEQSWAQNRRAVTVTIQ